MPKGCTAIRALVAGGLVVLAAGHALAQSEVTQSSSFDWSGFYLGIHTGGAVELSDVGDPYGTSIFGDTVTTPFFGTGAQAGVNWQMPDARIVFGVQADFEYRDGTGTNTCFAPAGIFTSSTCKVDLDWGGSLTGRIGIAAGDKGRSLFYVKGGAALQREHVSATTNNFFGSGLTNKTYSRYTDWGWTVGVGAERAVAPNWSVNLEYAFTDFGRSNFTASGGAAVDTATGAFVTVGPAATRIDQTSHAFKLGVNYRLGARGEWEEPDERAPVAAEFADGWAFESGLRYWYSTGKFQKDLPAFPAPDTSLISRLTYDDVNGHSGEAFARVDTPFRLFVKGTAGLGTSTGGTLNDEDWGLTGAGGGAPFVAYSNTLSNLSDDKLRYATADLGFNVVKNARAKVGPFVGYNYYHTKMTANDCTQIALPASGICSPALSGFTVISEEDNWNSVRVGGSAELMLSNRIKLSGEAAYLPYVNFDGEDNHPLRPFVADEDGIGRGVQLEAIVSLALSERFSLGVGGRYWSMWTTEGSDVTNFPGQAPITGNRNDTYTAERYGVMVQGSYKLGMPKRPAN